MIFKQISPLELSVGFRNATTSTMLKSGPVISAAGVPSPGAVALGNGWYKFSYLVDAGIAIGDNIQIYFGRLTSSPEGASWRIAGITVVYAIDAHLPYQRVTTAANYDADPAKFPAYLRFDGVDDALQTGNIDFTSTDKMTVWAGVTKLSDAALGQIAEFGNFATPLDRSWQLSAPASATPTLGFASRGTITASANSAAYPAPVSGVLCGVGDIGAPLARSYINGIQIATSSSPQGSGNYGNHPMFVGSRAGTSGFLNGRLYSLIVRGAQTPLSQIEATERHIKQKMRLP